MTLVRDLPPLVVTDRLDRLRATLPDAAADALLVTDLTNVRWLCGFTGSAGRLLVTTDRALLVTDGRYTEQARAQLAASGADVGLEIRGVEQLEPIARAAGPVARLGLEAASVTWAEQRAVAAASVSMFTEAPKAAGPFTDEPTPRWICMDPTLDAKSGRFTQNTPCDSASLRGMPLMVTLIRVSSVPRMRSPV